MCIASGWMGENDDGWRRKGEGSRPDRLDGRGIVFVVVVVVVVVVNRVQRRWTMAGDVLDDRPMPNDLDQGEERALRVTLMLLWPSSTPRTRTPY